MSRILFFCFALYASVFAGTNKIIGIVINKIDDVDIKKDEKKSIYGEFGYYATRHHYADAVEELCEGVSVVFLKPDVKNVETYATILDGLLIPGNTPDINPAVYGEKPIMDLEIDKYRTNFEIALIKKLYPQKKPILGICGGHQIINVAFGGTLYQDIPSQIKGKINHNPFSNPSVTVHDVDIAQQHSKIFGEDVKRFAVNSLHHQAVKDIPDGFVVIARSDDGVIEGIQKRGYPFLVGVQWHPELQLSKYDKNLIKSFCTAVKNSENSEDKTSIKIEVTKN